MSFHKQTFHQDTFHQDLSSLTEKELIKKIKGGSSNWKDWYFEDHPDRQKYYEEIERRNQEIPKPEGSYEKIFLDDPYGLKKLRKKILVLEEEHDYWKKIIKFPARTYFNYRYKGEHPLGDAKWYSLSSASTNLKNARDKLLSLEGRK